MRWPMIESLKIVFLFWLVSLTPSCSATVIVHPVSHTDAWVKVSDTVDIRLNVFLDDVLRHQGLLPDVESTEAKLPRQVVQKAIAAHGQILLRQLRIYQDQGAAMTGVVVAQPQWKSAADTVNLAIDSSLKLTWKLQFTSAEEGPIRQLLFLHDFTHPFLEQTGELRLHLQDSASGRRIDAVIPARQPHTILLPEKSTDSPTNREFANQLTSHIVLGPTHVVVEFSAPILLMDFAVPAVRRVKADLKFDENELAGPVWNLSKQAQAKQALAEWASDNLRMEINGEWVDPAVVLVEFFPVTTAVDAGQITDESEKMTTEDLPLIGTAAGIRLSYERGLSVAKIELQMQESLGLFDEANVSVSRPNERYSSLVSLTDAGANQSVFKYIWELSGSQLEFNASALVLETASVSVKSELLIAIRRRLSSVIAASVIVLMGLICFAHGMLATVKRPRFAVVMLLVSVVFAITRFSDKTYDVATDGVQAVMKSNLSTVYMALQQNDEQVSVELLSGVLDDDMLEEIYVGALKSLHSEADEPLAFIRSIQIEECDASEVTSVRELVAACRWKVDAVVEHWGHSHNRSLVFEGTVGLVNDDGRWKIRSFKAVGIPQPAS